MAVKTKISATKVAKLRRSGVTWQGVRDELGVSTSSGKFTAILAEEGFDAAGLKEGSSQKSKARVRGSANGSKPAAKKGTAKTTAKTTGKKGKAKVTRRVKRSGNPQA